MRLLQRALLALAALAPLALAPAVQAQPCTGNVMLTSQAEVDAFACETVDGQLRIFGSSITNLDGLAALTSAGSLTLSDTHSLTNLNGLAALTSVGALRIFGADALTSFSGLASLTSVGKLLIDDADALISFTGLSALTSVGALVIRDSDALITLSGLSALTSVGDLTISGNDVLEDLNALASLTTMETVTIIGNDALRTLVGLRNLVAVGELSIYFNPLLRNVDPLAGLLTIGEPLGSGELSLWGNPALENIDGLTDITHLRNLLIRKNGSLTNIDGLSGVTTVDGYIHVEGNEALENLNGLGKVTTTDGNVFISGNTALTNIDGLNALTRVGNRSLSGARGLTLRDNTNLVRCAVGVGGLLTAFQTDPSVIASQEIDISNNAPGGDCTSVASVLAAADSRFCTADFEITTQAQVDDFGCETSSGFIRVTGDAVSDLHGFSELRSANRLLIGSSTTLSDLQGLGNLRRVDNQFFLYQLENLIDLDALTSLDTLTGFTQFIENPNLEDVDGLSGLTAVGRLRIADNTSLDNLDGLASLTSATRFEVFRNPDLDRCGVGLGPIFTLDQSAPDTIASEDNVFLSNSPSGDCNSIADFLDSSENGVCVGNYSITEQAKIDAFNCRSVSGELNIRFDDITNLDGLAGLVSVSEALSIEDNDNLTNVDGLSSLTHVGGAFSLAYLPRLENVDALARLTSVGGGLELNVLGVTNVDSLANLKTLGTASSGESLFIRANPRLENVDGFSGLDQINASGLFVRSNAALTNLDGLAGVTQIVGDESHGLTVAGNLALVRCAVGLGPVLTLDQTDDFAVTGPIEIGSNAPSGDCNSVASILEAFAPPPPVVTLPLADISVTVPGGGPLVLPAGRAQVRVRASATFTGETGQRFTVFLRLDGPDGYSRIAKRGEIKPRVGQTVSQSIKFTTLASDPAGDYTLTLLAAAGSVPMSAAGEAEVLATLPGVKGGGLNLRADEPLSVFPNPTAGQATLRFALPEQAEATLVIYDALGREVARLVDAEVEGLVTEPVDASRLAPGLYVARLVAGDRVETVRLSVVR